MAARVSLLSRLGECVYSVIIPAARSREITRSLVNALQASSDLDVVVASPVFSIDNVTMFNDGFAGSAASIALALPYTRPMSTHVAWLSDECWPTDGCLDKMVRFLDQHTAPFIGEFFVGDEGCFVGDRRYARWGMVSRRTIDAIDFFDAAYRSYYGDVDYSMRCWEAGGSVEICRDARIVHTNREEMGNRSKHFDEDHARYTARWASYPV